MQKFSLGDNLHEMSKFHFLEEIKQNVSKYLLNFLPSMLSPIKFYVIHFSVSCRRCMMLKQFSSNHSVCF